MTEYELTIEDIDILRDAVKEWVTADKNTSRLAGLILGGMMANNGDTAAGIKAFEGMMDGEDEKELIRTEQAALLQAKLILIRRKLMANEAGKFLTGGDE